MTKEPPGHGRLAWEKARRLLPATGSQTRFLENWPESFTPEELVLLQYPYEGTDTDKRKARGNQAAMLRALKAAIAQGEIETARREITVQHHKEINLFRAPVRHATPQRRLRVKTGEEVLEIPAITRQGCRQWLALEGETPSEHIRAWLGDAPQTVAPASAAKSAMAWDEMDFAQRKAAWNAMEAPARRAKAVALFRKFGTYAAAGREVGVSGKRIGQLVQEAEEAEAATKPKSKKSTLPAKSKTGPFGLLPPRRSKTST